MSKAATLEHEGFSAAISEISEALNALRLAIAALQRGFSADSSLCAWVQAQPFVSSDDPRTIASEITGLLEFMPWQSTKETFICPGLIGCSEETLNYAHQVNQTKTAFKAVITRLKAKKIVIHHPQIRQALQQAVDKRDAQTRYVLRRIGVERLHLKQCYRKFPIIARPSKVRWTWAHTRSIKRISREQAEQLLLKRQDQYAIQHQLKRLAALQANESLAIVQELAPHLRANCLFDEGTPQVSRCMLKGPMPILFPVQIGTLLPDFKPPKDKQDRDNDRVIRADTKIEPAPYLPAIRAHRYLDDT